MDFGSKYVYTYAHSEEESLTDDDDEIPEHGPSWLALPAHGEEAGAGAVEQQVSATSETGRKRKHLRKPDTNVLSIKFNRLLQPGEMHAGDPVSCQECGAIASNLSKIQVEKHEITGEGADAEPKSTWHCEFCPKVNEVDIEQAELPKQEDATYLISPAPVVQGSDMTGVDDSMVLFVIDISGSMSTTTLVKGEFHLPNALKQEERAAEMFGGAHLIRQRHQTYVSRLQGVQMAVAANIDKLVKDTPTKRALLLSFNHELTYYGDGTRDEPLVIRGDKLNSADDLAREAERELNNELKSVAQTKAKLTERVYDLEEGGQTALGPAVVFALNIASRRPGSRIVICTDGLANRGLGSLEMAQDDKIDPALKLQALDEGNHFYADVTERAREKGVSISVITIKGTTCLLPVIGQMADGSGGGVTIVDLMNMRDEFASILEQQVIATNAVATLILHRGLYIRNPDNPEEKLQKTTRDVGNVTKHTEVTFEFGVRNREEMKEKYGVSLDHLQQLPFQIQVTYTAADGSKALRVLTQLKETTENREVAEVHAIRSVIAENHIRSTANDMMAALSDEEEDYATPLSRSKWSKPVVQRQRVAYMENLSRKVLARPTEEADEFNERRWNAASNDLRSQVIASKSRIKSRDRPAALTYNEEEARGAAAAPASSSNRSTAKKSYGFSSRKAVRYDDSCSENLYRYKNISSDYMRETSPTRESAEQPPAVAPERFPATRRFTPREDDDDDDDEKDKRKSGRPAPASSRRRPSKE